MCLPDTRCFGKRVTCKLVDCIANGLPELFHNMIFLSERFRYLQVIRRSCVLEEIVIPQSLHLCANNAWQTLAYTLVHDVTTGWQFIVPRNTDANSSLSLPFLVLVLIMLSNRQRFTSCNLRPFGWMSLFVIIMLWPGIHCVKRVVHTKRNHLNRASIKLSMPFSPW